MVTVISCYNFYLPQGSMIKNSNTIITDVVFLVDLHLSIFKLGLK